MKLKSTLLVLAGAVSLQTSAQTWVTDSVTLNPGYTHDVFYDLFDGDKTSHVANDWHIAFQTTKFGETDFNASIRASHINGKVQVYSLHQKASTKFGSLSASDTVGLTDPNMQLVNDNTSWGAGAFSANGGSTQFDFGWGEYDMNTHNLVGDSLYLVVVNSMPYQLWIQEYKSTGNVGYRFRVAKFDGTGDVTDTLNVVAPYNDRLFAYYDITTGQFVDREPSRSNWDILFTRYQNGVVFGQVPGQVQSYTGVLSNLDVEVAEIVGVDPNTLTTSNFSNQLGGLSAEVNVIGDDWKTFNMSTFMYELDTMTSYIVKSVNSGTFYHLRFTRFDGTATGTVVFQKRALATTSVKNVASAVSEYSVYPNPAQNKVNIVMDAKTTAANTQLVLMDMTGRVLQNTTISLNKGVNAYSFDVSAYPTGTYVIMVNGGDWKVAEKIMVQH